MNSIERGFTKKLWAFNANDITCCSGNSLLVTYCSATKVKSHARTRKEHLFSEETIIIFTRDR